MLCPSYVNRRANVGGPRKGIVLRGNVENEIAMCQWAEHGSTNLSSSFDTIVEVMDEELAERKK